MELARGSDVVVVARQSSFRFNPASVDPEEVGRTLGVRFVYPSDELYLLAGRPDVPPALAATIAKAASCQLLPVAKKISAAKAAPVQANPASIPFLFAVRSASAPRS